MRWTAFAVGLMALASCGGRGSSPPLASGSIPSAAGSGKTQAAVEMDRLFPSSRSPGSIRPGHIAAGLRDPAGWMEAHTRRSAMPQSLGGPLMWTQLPGQVSQVVVSPADGSLWALTAASSGGNSSIYHYSGTWSQITGLASRLAISPDGGTLYALNAAGGIFAYSVASGTWTGLAGGASDVTAGSDGTLYVLSNGFTNGNAGIWHYVNGTWTQLPGAAVRISANWDPGAYVLGGQAVDPGGFYVFNNEGAIFYYSTAVGWLQFPGAASSLAPVTGGLFVVGSPAINEGGAPIYYFDLTNQGWTLESGAGISIAAGSTQIYVANAAGSLYSSPITLVSPAPVPTTGPALSVDVAASPHPISPDIYGVTIFWSTSTPQDLATFAKAIGLPVNRYGGDATTRYNWNVDSSNAGSDWYFMAGNGQANAVPGASVDAIVNGNLANGTKSIITVPIIDWINAASPWNCSYPNPPVANQVGINGNPAYNPYIQVSGAQCGSGSNASGYINDGNPGATDTQNSPSIQQAWVAHFAGKYGQGGHGGVPIYELDNEPNGWIAVHHDVRPQNIGYTELFQKSLAYAQAIKAADPTALVLGPGDIPPADENCNNGSPSGVQGTCTMDNANQHGGTPLGLWYLQQFAQQSPRMLDYYSMHYPGACCFNSNGTLADMVTIIQRHKGWIKSAYPGTKLAYDEWNRGTGNAYANALTTADGLGVMGQQGVDLASFWGLNDASYPSAFAFLMFRNYDGAGSRFGDTSVTAASANPSQLTVYAAQRSSDSALTVLVVNSSNAALTSTLSLANIQVAQAIDRYAYTPANPQAIVAEPPLAPSQNPEITFPAQSLTMIVVPYGSTPLAHTR